MDGRSAGNWIRSSIVVIGLCPVLIEAQPSTSKDEAFKENISALASSDPAQRMVGLAAVAEDYDCPATGSLAADILSQIIASGDSRWRETLPAASDLARSQHKLAFTLWECSNDRMRRQPEELELAVELSRRALEIWTLLAPQSLEEAAASQNLGLMIADLGDLASAERHLNNALKVLEKLAPESLSLATIFYNLGLIHDLRGELDSATSYWQQTLKIQEEKVAESVEITSTLRNLGLAAWTRGDLRQADSYLRRALEMRRTLVSESDLMIESLCDLVQFKLHEISRSNSSGRFLEKMKLALGLVAEAAAIREAIGWVKPPVSGRLWQLETFVANFFLRLADSFSRNGDVETATEYLNEVRVLALYESSALVQLGELYLENNLLIRAEDYFQQARKIENIDDPSRRASGPTVLKILNGLGRVYRNRGELALASDYLYRSLSEIDYLAHTFGHSLIMVEYRGRDNVRYFKDLIDLELQLDRAEAALAVFERSKAKTLLALMAQKPVFDSLPDEWREGRRLRAKEYDRILAKINNLSPGTASEEMDELKRRLWDAHFGLRFEVPEKGVLEDIQYPQPLEFSGIQDALSPGTTMLAYSVGEQRTYLFVVSGGLPLRVFPLSVSRKELRGQVERWGQQTYGRNWATREASRFVLGAWLYDRLIGPAERVLRVSDRLVIVPDDVLYGLPFASLIRKKGDFQETLRNWQYLIEWKPIHTVLSSSLYTKLQGSGRRADEAKAARSRLRIAVFGDPYYPQQSEDFRRQPGKTVEVGGSESMNIYNAVRRSRSYLALPHSRSEVERIADLYSHERVQVFLGHDATEEQVKALGESVDIVHFAVHATQDERYPFNSALALTIRNDLSDGRDNGLLQTWEIFEYVRLDADLVVLSACETLLGRQLDGEGPIGLPYAFLFAGARSVAATLWKVADQATAELMVRFHRHLRAGLSKDEALRAAQIELIRGPIEVENGNGEVVERDFSAPYYWASFQIYGDWQ